MFVVRGRVVGPRGTAAAEAAVHIVTSSTPVPDIAQLTDPEGNFTLALPKAGQYRIGANAGSLGTGHGEVTVGEAENVFLEIQLSPTQPPSEP